MIIPSHFIRLEPHNPSFSMNSQGRAFGLFVSASPWLAALCGWHGKAFKGNIQCGNGMSILKIWFIFPSIYLIFYFSLVWLLLCVPMNTSNLQKAYLVRKWNEHIEESFIIFIFFSFPFPWLFDLLSTWLMPAQQWHSYKGLKSFGIPQSNSTSVYPGPPS